MKKITLLILLFLVYFNSYSQTDTININNTFYTSQTIYRFMPNQTIYGLRINGSITYTDYTSLARVVLVKSDSSELLIYEAYPWLYYYNGNGSFYFSNAGDETYYLDAMDVSYIKVEINNAKIVLTTMLIDTVYNINIPTWQTQYIDSLRQNKIDSINNNIQAHNLLWRAGDNTVAQMTFNNKKKIFSNDSLKSILFNTFGFEYYMGGVFSFLGASLPSPKQSNIVDNFDWRNRHSANWLTPVQDQTPIWACWAYAAVASLESIINLYFNQHLDKNLSEQAFVSCMHTIYSISQCHGGAPSTNVLCKASELGVLKDTCYPEIHKYDDYGLDSNGVPCHGLLPGCTLCGDLCPNWTSNLWKITGFMELEGTNWYSPNCSFCQLLTEDSLKKNIILNGPLAFSMPWTPINGTYVYHAMLVLGFGVINTGDTIYSGPGNPIIVPADDSLIGQVYWIVKNSGGTTWGENGYGKFILNLDGITASVVLNPITQQPTSATYQVSCTDNDGDGYYWWGIGVKPATCPLYTPNERDCDDSDPLVGPYDNEYNCTPLCALDNVTKEINGYYPIDINEYMTNEIIDLKSGSTLIIENNATLFIHSATEIVVENNATLTLENYGKIRVCGGYPWQGSITVEQGGTLNVECVDNDNDGYYWWGTIGPNPSSCSSLAPDEIDCDDTDPLVGPGCTPICFYDTAWTNINNDTTINYNQYLTTNIKVKSGHTLKIENHATLFIHPLSQIIVENSAVLYLDNGNIKVCSDAAWQGNITAGTGAQVRIEHESVFIDKSIPEWMPANMNVGTRIDAATNQSDNSTVEKYCYGNIPANCDIYGGLYQWGEAMQYVGSVNCDPCGPTTGHGGAQGICPTGYHIPSDLEWSRYEWSIENKIAPTGTTSLSTFQETIGGRGSYVSGVGPGVKMKSTSDWNSQGNGTNTSGFNGLPVGYFDSGSFTGLGSNTFYWSATQQSGGNALCRYLIDGSNRIFRINTSNALGLSVRCLKD